MQFKPGIPVLRIFDHPLAIKFYVDWLAFQVNWEHRFDENAPRYLQISRDGVVLHLSEHYGDCSPGAKVLIHVDDIVALHEEVNAHPNPYMRPGLKTEPWNARTMTVIDPFHNQLVFIQTGK